jgi:hypothetical protein
MNSPKTAGGMNSTSPEDMSVDSTRIIEMQKEEIKRQRARISELEVYFLFVRQLKIYNEIQATALRPYSRERLPPMDGLLNTNEF